MFNLETEVMSGAEKRDFIEWFNSEIGTEYEINECASGAPDSFYVYCFELTNAEYFKVKNKLGTIKASQNIGG